LATFLLTNLLLPNLERTNSRIVHVSAALAQFGEIDINQLMETPQNYSTFGFQSYYNSKLAQVIYSNELQRRLAASGSKATSNSLHPGVIATELVRDLWGGAIFGAVMRSLGKNEFDGAQSTLYLAMSAKMEGVGGTFTLNRDIYPIHPKENDKELASALWKKSEELVNSK